jgi:hypothetical protein
VTKFLEEWDKIVIVQIKNSRIRMLSNTNIYPVSMTLSWGK